jgi:hypothetical protein
MGPANPQALNRYAYVLNNPVRYIDPSGHSIYLSNREARAFASALNQVALELGSLSALQFDSAGIIKYLYEKADLVGRAFNSTSQVFFKAIIVGLAEAVAAGSIFGIGIGAALCGAAAHSFAQLANEIEGLNGNSGVGIAIDNDSVLILDRESGEIRSWIPGVSIGGYLVMSHMPSSWRLGERPVGDSGWASNYHFSEDQPWFYATFD